MTDSAARRRDAQLRSLPDDFKDTRARKLRNYRLPKRAPKLDGKRLTSYLPEALPNEDARPGSPLVPKHVRLGIMFLALQEGVKPVAEQFGMAESTIYNWFKDEGGLTEIRSYVASSATHAFISLIQASCEELARRIPEANNDDLMLNFRKMLEVGEKLMGRLDGSKADTKENPIGGNQPFVLNIQAALPAPNQENNPPEGVVEGEVTSVFDD